MAKSNEGITMKGNPIKVLGPVLEAGAKIPDVVLTGPDLADVPLSKFAGKKLVVVSVPSLDTPTCSIETKRFNKEATSMSDVVVVVVSRDLPFAQKRWCGAEGVESLVVLSDYKHRSFAQAFGVDWVDPGLLARAVFVVDKTGTVQLADYVDEIADEPNYESILAAVKSLA